MDPDPCNNFPTCECGEPIEPGDDVVHCEDGTYWHSDCYRDAQYPCHGTRFVMEEGDYVSA